MSGIYSKKILLIEHDPAVRAALTERLGVKGYEVFSLENPEETALELAHFKPDLVVLSLVFPKVDSLAVLEQIRALPKKEFANVPVVVGSRTGDLVEIGKALRLGIKDYFVYTSFSPDQVVEKIERHLIHLARAAPPSVSEEILKSKLLIIEDDKFLRDLAAQKLAREHLNVLTAVDGEQGLAIAEKEKPGIMLLDILLPGIDGYEVLRRIRANPVLTHMRVIMLSNFGQREDVDKALKLGADQFLVKANYTLDEIVQEIKKMLTKPK